MVAQNKKNAQSRSYKTKPTVSLLDEKVILFRDLLKQLTFTVSLERLQRWATKGTMNRFTKKRVSLQCVRLPQGYATSHEAMRRFLLAINETPAEKKKSRA